MRPLWVMLLLAVLAVIAYFPGLSGDFVFDDIPNIVENPHLQQHSLTWEAFKDAALSSDAGPLKRPVSMLSLAVNAYFSGLDPRAYKVTNLILHTLTAGLVYLFSLAVLRSWNARTLTNQTALPTWGALMVAATWTVHPLNSIPVLMVVQRMTTLSALFTMLTLLTYLRARQEPALNSRALASLVPGFALAWPLGILSKENSLLLPVYLLATEALVLRFRAPDGSICHRLKRCYLSISLLGLAALAVFLFAIWSNLVVSYQYRPFSLEERALTQLRVLWHYVGYIVLPMLPRLGLFHDDIQLSQGWLMPWTTLLAAISWLVSIVVAHHYRQRAPWLAFGLLMFLGGHFLESSIFPLEMAHEHRNYLPMLGVLLMLAQGVIALLAMTSTSERSQRLLHAAPVLIMLGFAGIAHIRAAHWSNAFTLVDAERRHHPNSPRARMEVGRRWFQLASEEEEPYRRERLFTQSFAELEAAYKLAPKAPETLVALLQARHITGKPITPILEEDLMAVARSAPLSGQSAAAITGLLRCINSGKCNFSFDFIQRYIETASRNPRWTRRELGIFFSEAANWALKSGQMDRALHFAILAQDSYPSDPQHSLNRLSILTSMGRIADAQAFVRTMDTRNFTQMHLKRLHQELNRLAPEVTQ